MRPIVTFLLVWLSTTVLWAQGDGLARLRLQEARAEEIKKYRAERTGEAPRLTAATEQKVKKAVSGLPGTLGDLVDRMLKGERPLELIPDNPYLDFEQLKPGDFGPINRGFCVGEILDKQTAVCYFPDWIGGEAVPDYTREFVLRGMDTTPMIVDRWYAFRGRFVLIRKSDDYPGLAVRKGVLAIEVVEDKAFLDLTTLIYPPPKTAKAAKTKRRK